MAETSLNSLVVEIRGQEEKFSTALKKIEGQLSSFEKKVNVSTQKAERAFDGLGATVGKFTLALNAVVGAVVFKKLADGIASVTKEAIESESAQQRLALTLRNTGQFSQTYATQIQAMASALQKTTTFSDEAISGTADLLIAFGATQAQLEPLTRAVLDLSVGLGAGLAPTTEAVARALTGNARGLKALGINIKEAKSEAEVFNQIIEQSARFQGQATAAAQTFGGALAQLTNLWGEVKEAIGGAIINNTKVLTVMQALKGVLIETAGAAGTLSGEFLTIGQTIASTSGIFSLLSTTLGELFTGLRAVAQAAALLSGGLTAMKETSDAFDLLAIKIETFTGKLNLSFKTNDKFNAQIAEFKGLAEDAAQGLAAPTVQLDALRKVYEEAVASGAIFNASSKEILTTFGLLSTAANTGTGSLNKFVAIGKEGKTTVDKLAKASEQAAEKLADARAEIEGQIAILGKQAVILERVLKGQLGTAEAAAEMAAAEQGAKAQSDALTASLAKAELKLDLLEQEVRQQDEAIEELVDGWAAYKTLLNEATEGLTREIASQEQYLQVLEKSIDGGKSLEEAQRDAAAAVELTTFWWTQYQDALDEGLPIQAAQQFADELTILQDRTMELTEETRQLAEAHADAAARMFDIGAAAEDVAANMGLAFLKSGGDIKKSFKSLKEDAVDIFEDLFRSTFRQKLNWEHKISGNLLNDIPKLFGKGAELASQAWGSGMDSDVTSTPGAGQFANVIGGGSSTNQAGAAAGQSWGSGFMGGVAGFFSGGGGGSTSTPGTGIFANVTGGSSTTSAAGTAAGSSWGSAAGVAAFAGIAASFGSAVSKSKWGTAGGTVIGGAIAAYFSAGNPAITALGAQLGGLIGGLFDPLFKHIKTKGTRIRSDIKIFLQEIEASFADEIDQGDYFFEESKALAKSMFGGDFLKASNQILNEQAGPELAKQLQALGVALSADQAMDLGKSVEQTGTTFGNMLLDNLGIDPEVIGDAIDEIVEKADISFISLTDKLTDVFDKGAISTEFYTKAIQGAVGIFFKDMPAAINVSAIALQSFTDEGIFSIEKFEKGVKDTMDQFLVIGEVFRAALLNSKDGAEAAKLFGAGLKEGLLALAQEKFIQDFFDTKLFEGVDLSDGLSSEEMVLLTERTKQARIELEALGTALGEVGQEFDLVRNIFREALLNSADGEAAARLFGAGLKKGLLALAQEEFIQDFISTKLFEGLDLSDGLDSAEIDTLTERTRRAREEMAALEAAFNAAGMTTEELMSQIEQLNARLLELGNKRIDIRVNLLADLETIGVISALEGINARFDILRQQYLDLVIPKLPTGPIAPGGAFANFNNDELEEAGRLLEQMNDLTVQRYQAELAAIEEAGAARIREIQDDFAARREATQEEFAERRTLLTKEFAARRDALEDEFQARRDAIGDTIDALQDEKELTQEYFQERLDGLREELRLAEEFQQVALRIADQVRGLAASAQSPLSAGEQLGFLQRQSAQLERQLATAAPAERPELMNRLAQILEEQLAPAGELFDGAQFERFFFSIASQLEQLQRQAGGEGGKAKSIEEQILQTEQNMDLALKSIDLRIEIQQELLKELSERERTAMEMLSEQERAAQEALSAQEQAALTALSLQEQAAIAAAEAATSFQIQELRRVTAEELQNNARIQENIRLEQIRRAEEQKQEAIAQLTALEGAEEAARLLSGPNNPQLLKLVDIDNTLANIDLHLQGFLALIQPTARGYEGMVTRPQLRLIGEAGPEYLSIRPRADMGQGRGAGGSVAVNITIPGLSIRVEGGADPVAAGESAGRALIRLIEQEAQHGRIGQIMDDRARRARP